MSEQTSIDQADLQPHEDAARDYRDYGVLTEWDRAAERGRAYAEAALMADPSRKIMVEAIYGKQYCMNRYPRAYKNTRQL